MLAGDLRGSRPTDICSLQVVAGLGMTIAATPAAVLGP